MKEEDSSTLLLKTSRKKKLYLSSLPLEGREQGFRFHSPKGLIWSPGQTANTDPENISEFLSTEGGCMLSL